MIVTFPINLIIDPDLLIRHIVDEKAQHVALLW